MRFFKNKARLCLLLVFFSINFTACINLLMPSTYSKVSTYLSLDGRYTFSNYRQGVLRYRSYTFDWTAKASYYSDNWNYTASRGWSNPSKGGSLFYYEWKIVNGTFYKKLWDNSYASWRSYDFELIDANNFKLDGRLYTKR